MATTGNLYDSSFNAMQITSSYQFSNTEYYMSLKNSLMNPLFSLVQGMSGDYVLQYTGNTFLNIDLSIHFPSTPYNGTIYLKSSSFNNDIERGHLAMTQGNASTLTIPQFSIAPQEILFFTFDTNESFFYTDLFFDSFSYSLSTPPGPPDAPLVLGATAGNQQATVTWQSPANDGGSPITHYYVFLYLTSTIYDSYNNLNLNTSTNAPGFPVTLGADQFEYTATGLTNGTSYTFALQSGNGLGYSGFGTIESLSVSNAVTPTAPPPPPPSGPVYNPNAQFQNSQVAIMNTTPGSATGGALIVNGGVSAKDTYITGHTVINAVDVTPNPGDIIYEQQYTLSNAQNSWADVTGLAFDNTKASTFDAQISVLANGKYALYKLNGVKLATGWTMSSWFTGEQTGVTFQVVDANGTGQIQYQNTNASGTTTIRARVVTNSL